MSFFQTLLEKTRRALWAQDVVTGAQLLTLSPVELDAWVSDPRDRRRIDRFIEEQIASGEPRGVVTPLFFGLLEAPAPRPAGQVLIVRRYANRAPWSEVSTEPGPLVRWFGAPGSGYPTTQRYGSCAAHATGSSLHLRGSGPLSPELAPSRRWLYVKSGQVGGHGSNEGRSYLEMQAVLHEHGLLLESECPTGEDAFNDLERYPRELELLARERRCAGTIWIDGRDGNASRLNAAWDLVNGRITGEPAGLLIAVKVYENWARSFHVGVIRRHHQAERLLGGHALVAIGAMELQGKTWILCANSWGREFASRSPIEVPGVALCSASYLAEIMYHGAALFCRNDQEFREAAQNFGVRPARRPTVIATSLAAERKTLRAAMMSNQNAAAARQPMFPWGFLAALIGAGLLASWLPEGPRQYVGVLLAGLLGAKFIARLPAVLETARSEIAMCTGNLVTSIRPRSRLLARLLDHSRGHELAVAGLLLLALAGFRDLPAAVPGLLGAALFAAGFWAHEEPARRWLPITAGVVTLLASALAGEGLGARLITASLGAAVLMSPMLGESPSPT